MATGLVRVTMKTNIVGTPSYCTGDVVDLRADIAAAWIKEGFATPVREDPVETAKR